MILDLFKKPEQQDNLVEFSNKIIKSFKSDLLQIFIILMEISSWPWALCIFAALIILRTLCLLKSRLC